LRKSAGTYHFFAPECCDTECEVYSGSKVDIWALGVTLFCLLYNRLPFWTENSRLSEFAILDVILK
jgi:serine/threonine protein kinase